MSTLSYSRYMRRCIQETFFKPFGKATYSQEACTSKEEDRRKALMAKNLPKRKPIPGVNKVLLVASGKGGVGKSTVAVNLAVSLKQIHPTKHISLLDADVFGPSLPRMMNLAGEPDLDSSNLMIPLQNHGIKCMSMGFLVAESAPVVWRGLMVMSAIDKLTRGVNWDPTDILVVDMPPGTGDTQLSFAQNVVIDGAVIVTTPQQVAVQDAVKGIEMFKKTQVPVLGFVLNMASYHCPSCGSLSQIGKDFRPLASKHGIPVLGELPFNLEISNACDSGNPITMAHKESLQAIEFKKIADTLYKELHNHE